MRETYRRPVFGVCFFLSAVFLIAVANGCRQKEVERKEVQEQMPERPIEEVLKEHTDELMSVEGVVGTAIGDCDGKPCIKVLVVKKTPALEKKIPSNLEGYAVSVVETGEIKALEKD